MKNVTVVSHPVVQDFITQLRNINTGTELYRIYAKHLNTFLVYEALSDLKTRSEKVATQTGVDYTGDRLDEKVAFVTILRAGLAMFIPALELFPNAEFHCVGMKRNEEDPFGTEPNFYLDRLHEMGPNVKRVVIVDPMFATGGSLITIVKALKKKHNYKGRIDFVCMIAARQGAEKLYAEFPDVHITCAGFDDELNEKGYIIPGLGDAGDRFFGINTDLSSIR